MNEELKRELKGKNIFVYNNDEFYIPATEVFEADIYNKETGKTIDGSAHYLEVKEFVKAFINEGCITNTYKMNNRGKEMLLYVIYHLDKACDFIEIDPKFYMGKFKIGSVNTFKKAIKDLVEYKYIHPIFGKKNIYWVNPNYFFRGSRLDFYPDKIRVQHVKDNSKPKNNGVYIKSNKL